jgi:hypothetical protein
LTVAAGQVKATVSPKSVRFTNTTNCRTVTVTLTNNTGAAVTVTAFAPQAPGAGETAFNINTINPALPQIINNGASKKFFVNICGTGVGIAKAPYFDITTSWGTVAAGVEESEDFEELEFNPEGLRAWSEGDRLHLWAESSVGVSSMEFQLFDLQGRKLLDVATRGDYLEVAPMDADGNLLANGVYLYVVTVRGYDGSVVRSEVRKLAIVR